MVCLKLITSGLMGNFHLIDLYPQASIYLFLGTVRMFGLNTTESPLLFNSSQKHSKGSAFVEGIFKNTQ